MVTKELEARIDRLETMVMLLCQEAARGQGQMGERFWKFIDDWRRERSELDAGDELNRTDDDGLIGIVPTA